MLLPADNTVKRSFPLWFTPFVVHVCVCMHVCVVGNGVTAALLMCHSSSWPGPGRKCDHAVALGFVTGEFAESKLFPDGASKAIWHWLNSSVLSGHGFGTDSEWTRC